MTKKKETEKQQDATVKAEALEALDMYDAREDQDTSDDQPRRRPAKKPKQTTDKPSNWERVESSLRMASLVAISLSVVLAAWQYYEKRLDEKKERSTRLMQEWQTSDERRNYEWLGQELEKVLAAGRSVSESAQEDEIEKLKSEIGDHVINTWRFGETADFDKGTAAIDSLFVFYSEVEFCIRAQLCDEILLQDYFATEVINFWQYFRTYAEDQRGQFYPNYGKPTENLVALFQDQSN
ncbi:MAG: hypothetical protein AAF625_09810 [Pseudomonadota bacterium]